MSSEPCTMENLVEARHDGRLGARENASLDCHLASCATCRELSRTLEEIRRHLRAPLPGSARMTPLEHQRGRLALLRAAVAPPSSHGRRRSSLGNRRAWLVAAAVVTAAVALLLVGHVGPTLRARAAVTVPLAQRLPAVSFQWPERTETTIHGSTEARFERRTEGPLERVELAEGRIDLSVRKLGPGERFVVSTTDAEVEVRGTIFEVEAHDGKLASVSVSEGKVEVRHHGARALITPGDTWRPSPPAESAPTSSAAPGSASAPASAPVSAPTPTSVAVSAPVGRRPRSPLPISVASAPVAREDNASTEFAAAVAKLASGDYGQASRQLAEFRKANPADARAEDAAFLAIVSLQRAGKSTEAKEAARRYLATYPNGDRRAEALEVAR